MIYHLLPESPKSSAATSNRCRILVGLKSVLYLAIAGVALFFATSGEVRELNRDGVVIVTGDSTAKDVSSGLVLDRDQTSLADLQPVEKIALLGERHSGTNWITDHLRDCFGRDIEVSSYADCCYHIKATCIHSYGHHCFRLLHITLDLSTGSRGKSCITGLPTQLW